MAIEITENTIIRLLVRRGSEAEKNTIILAQGEPGFALDTQTFVVGDGATKGGLPIPNTDDTSIEWAGTTPDYIQVADGGVTNTKLANMAGNSVKGNTSSTPTSPSDVGVTANSLVGRIGSLNSGNLTSIPISTIFNSFFSLVAPDPTFTQYWFNLNNYKWYSYDGVSWLSLHQYAASGPERLLYVGSGSSVATYDGGDTNAPSVSSGPMWEVDSDYTSKVLRGAADGNTATVPLDNGGNDSVEMTAAMIAPHRHNVAVLIPGHGGSDGTRDAADGGTYSTPNASNPNLDWTGILSPLPPGSTAGKYPKDSSGLPAVYEDYGNGVTNPAQPPTNLPTLPAYQGVLVLKRTSRAYYVV